MARERCGLHQLGEQGGFDVFAKGAGDLLVLELLTVELLGARRDLNWRFLRLCAKRSLHDEGLMNAVFVIFGDFGAGQHLHVERPHMLDKVRPLRIDKA